jgi:hypothetical protein
MIKNLLVNWKTTSAGLLMIIGSTVHLVYAVKDGTANENTWTISLTAVVGGVGLIFAGDSSAPPKPTPPNDNQGTPPAGG